MKESAGPPRVLPADALALRPRIEAVCLRLLRHRADAEDAVQTVYSLFLEREPEIDPARREAWLLRTAVLVSKNERRARARRARPPAPRPAAPPAGSDEPACPPLGDALASLPSPLREALSLRYLRERSVPETAAALGCPPRTLEKRLRRGLDLLRRILARRGWLSLPAALAAALGGRRLEACARSAAPGVAVAGVLLLAGSMALRRAAPEVDAPRAATAALASVVEPDVAVRGASSPAAAPRTEPVGLGDRAAPASVPAPFDEFARRWLRVSNRPRILENWRQLGIDASLEVLAAAPPDAPSTSVVASVFQEWAGRDGRAAAAWLEEVYATLPEGWMPDAGADAQAPHLGAVILRAWRDVAPEDVRTWMAALPGGRTRDWWEAHQVLADAAAPDARLETLAQRLDRLPWDNVKLHSMIAVVKSWAAQDPNAAADWICRRGWKDRPDRPAAPAVHSSKERPLIDALSPLIIHRWRGASLEYQAEACALSAVVHAWAARDPEAAWRWCRSRPSSSRAGTSLSALGYALAQRDPKTALRYVNQIPDSGMQARWRESIAFSLAETDPEAAFLVAEQLPPGDDRDQALHAVLTTAAVSRPDIGAEWLARRLPDLLSGSDFLKSSAGGFVDHWADHAPQAAAEWVQGRPDPDWRVRKLKDVGARWAAADPAGIAAHAEANASSPAWAPLYGAAALRLWGKDRAAAFRIADRMAPGAARREALEGIAAKWAEVDPCASGAWALRRADPSERDAALLGIVRELADQGRPEEADAWVAHLRDEQARAKARDLLR